MVAATGDREGLLVSTGNPRCCLTSYNTQHSPHNQYPAPSVNSARLKNSVPDKKRFKQNSTDMAGIKKKTEVLSLSISSCCNNATMLPQNSVAYNCTSFPFVALGSLGIFLPQALFI